MFTYTWRDQGGRQYSRKAGDTVAQAEAFKRRIDDQLALGEYRAVSTTTFATYATAWIEVAALKEQTRYRYRSILRRETPENLWIKCPDSGQLVFYKDVEANQFVIPGSNYHMRMGAVARLKSVFDNETWYDIALPDVTADPLKFRDSRKYRDRIIAAQKKEIAEFDRWLAKQK